LLPFYAPSPFGDSAERLVGKGKIDALHLEQALVLLDERVLRLGEDALERRLVKVRIHGVGGPL
jgi:hypothetical protein